MTPTTKPVLIADDQPALRTAFVRALQRHGFETLEANSGPEVLDLLATAPCSAVVLDNHMPGITGIELVEAIRSDPATVDLPIVLATGSSSPSDIELALRLGANAYLSKPVDLATLVETVQRLVNHEVALP